MGRLALLRRGALVWEAPMAGAMRVPAVFLGSAQAMDAMEHDVMTQLTNVASLPGIVPPALAMPDAHTGYGFPIGGVAAFDAAAGGVICAGGVGFDIACGVRALLTNLTRDEVEPVKDLLADRLFARVPAGLGSSGRPRLSNRDMDRMLTGGAAWAVKEGYGEPADLPHIEENGTMADADPGGVSARARERGRDAVGSLGSGNHYLEVQYVDAILDAEAATAYGLAPEQVVVAIHCGSRGLGHQTATDWIARMRAKASHDGLTLPDPELACAPLDSATGRGYLGAMRAAGNCALAGRQVITQLVRDVFTELFPGSRLALLCDVSHNTCRIETHAVAGTPKRLAVHRKGATRAVGPHHPDRPPLYPGFGQPVLVGGSMGTASYILSGGDAAVDRSFASTCHGAGRAMSRKQALKRFRSREVLDALARDGVVLRAHDFRGVGEEAPQAYKDIEEVVWTTHALGLATHTARLRPMACIKG